MKNTKKSLILSVCLLSVFVLSIIGISYAYYAANITGNDATNPSISLKSGYLSIKYTDGSQSLNTGDTTITGGTTLTKTFSVTNSGTKSAYYAVWLKNVVNPFTRTKDWTYVLSVKDVIISSGEIPTQDTAIVVARGLEKGVKEDLTLKVTYAKTSEDQSADMNKTLEFNVSVSQALSNLDKAEEGTLLNAINKNNAVVQTITVPGKTPSGYSDTYQEGTLSETEGTLTVDGTNQLAYADAYTFDTTKNVYNLTSATTGTYSDVYASLTGKYISVPAATATSTDLPKIYKVVSATDTTLTYLELSEGTKATVSEAILASTEDDYGTSYYFRGNVKNNYVNFAGMCWRIVRIAGDGSVKMTLAAQKDCSEITGSNTGTAFIGTGNYGYENTSGSELELNKMNYLSPVTDNTSSMVKAFYDFQTTNLASYLDKLKSGDWCLGDTAYSQTGSSNSDYTYTLLTDTSSNYLSKTKFYYDAYARITGNNKDGYSATLKCNGTKLDKFRTVENVSSETPMYVSTLTIDEVAFAGGSFTGENTNYYLYDNASSNWWWTLSPYAFDGASDVAFHVYLTGNLYTISVDASEGAFRPAISLASGAQITSGDGTKTNPYVIK